MNEFELEFSTVTERLAQLPPVTLPDSLTAAALFAKMDAQQLPQATPAARRQDSKAVVLHFVSQYRSVLTYAAAFAVLVLVYYGAGFNQTKEGNFANDTAMRSALPQFSASAASSSAAAAPMPETLMMAAPAAAPEAKNQTELAQTTDGNAAGENGTVPGTTESAKNDAVRNDAAIDAGAPPFRPALGEAAFDQVWYFDRLRADVDSTAAVGQRMVLSAEVRDGDPLTLTAAAPIKSFATALQPIFCDIGVISLSNDQSRRYHQDGAWQCRITVADLRYYLYVYDDFAVVERDEMRTFVGFTPEKCQQVNQLILDSTK
ncbi:MAG: hypothetical protein RR185_03145 [Angelakisella sp.]